MYLLITLLVITAAIILFIAAVLLDIYCGIRFKKASARERTLSTGFNDLHYYTNGHELFEAMKESIQGARHHIHISFFIFVADEVGNEWLSLLKKKAEEGIEVRLLVDTLSSWALRKKGPELAQSGLQLAFSGKPTFPFIFYSLNRRNHRKIMVIDGSVGYFGGFNVSLDYIGRNPGMGPWHDNHLRVEGESMHTLQHLFLEDWKKATAVDLLHDATYFPKTAKGTAALSLIGTDGKQLEDLFADYLGSAQTSIVIASPYFVPSKKLMPALIDRLDHGVTLTIVLPMKKDHPLVKPASYHYLEPLLKKGAKLFHFYQGFYHAKLFVIDHSRCYLGTANFDQRSLFWNDELSGFCDDPALAHRVLELLHKEISNQSVAVPYAQIRKRSLYEKGKTLCSTWLSYFL